MAKTYLLLMVSLDWSFEGPKHDPYWHNVGQDFVNH
jgi:hypothetical protein